MSKAPGRCGIETVQRPGRFSLRPARYWSLRPDGRTSVDGKPLVCRPAVTSAAVRSWTSATDLGQGGDGSAADGSSVGQQGVTAAWAAQQLLVAHNRHQAPKLVAAHGILLPTLVTSTCFLRWRRPAFWGRAGGREATVAVGRIAHHARPFGVRRARQVGVEAIQRQQSARTLMNLIPATVRKDANLLGILPNILRG